MFLEAVLFFRLTRIFFFFFLVLCKIFIEFDSYLKKCQSRVSYFVFRNELMTIY
jgi:hypothetical protein